MSDTWVRDLSEQDLYRQAWAYRKKCGYGAAVLEREIERREAERREAERDES